MKKYKNFVKIQERIGYGSDNEQSGEQVIFNSLLKYKFDVQESIGWV